MNTPIHPPLSRLPEGIQAARDYEFLARRHVAGPTLAYIEGGSGDDVSVRANRNAFERVTITPRLLRDVSGGHTRLTLAGRTLAHPILLAPVAFQTLVHGQGERETARAAAATETVMVLSTLATTALEDVAALAGPAPWFQLYFQPDRAATLALLRRAEAAGYGALVVTLDAVIQAPSRSALHAGFRMPPECVPVNPPPAAPASGERPGPGQSVIFQGLMRQAPTWADLAWLMESTRLPVWIKGVLHPEDAVQLRARGVAGLVVSNHGGRSLDHAPATLAALPALRAAVGDACPLLLDGGIRSGADVFKAIALGADAVAVGRLQVHALAVAGALGVAHMLKLMREELETTMAMAGCATLADVRAASVAWTDLGNPH